MNAPLIELADAAAKGRTFNRSSLVSAVFSLAALFAAAALSACAAAPPPVPSAVATPATPPDPRLGPPPFAAAPSSPAAREDQRTAVRREILDAAWRTVRDLHYDPLLGGLDWNAVRRRYEPLALSAPNEAAFYRTLNDMIGELGQSHMMITGPGADDDLPVGEPAADAAAAAGPGTTDPTVARDVGEPGLTVRIIDGRPTVTSVRPGSSAARHGVAMGFVVTAIGGRPLGPVTAGHRALRPVEERFAARQTASHALVGPVGSKVTFSFLDNNDRPGQVILDRDPPAGPLRQIGHLPPLHPETRVAEIDGVGVIAFNIFLLDPLLDEIKRAVDGFSARRVKGVILDLRGNPGGLGAMAIPVASEFVTAPITLGTLQFRTFSQIFIAKPSLGRTPYPGPLVILTDEGTASAAEILAAGLQEAGRARVVGDTSVGAVLPSLVEALPHGAVIQMVVADFKTPKGILLEGRGVQPDQRVLETRSAFRAGRDPVLDAALATIRTMHVAQPGAKPATATTKTPRTNTVITPKLAPAPPP